MNPALEAALAHGWPRYFRAADGAAMGKTGVEDTERFGDDLMAYQECAQMIGQKLEMNSISYGVVYDRDDTVCFRFNPNSDPMNPELVGSIVSRRMPMREMLNAVNEYMNG
jgi:hypothetical protein